MKKLYFAFACLSLLFACKNDSPAIKEVPKTGGNFGPLSFESQKLERKSEGCRVTANYLVASGGEEAVRGKINAIILNFLAKSMTTPSENKIGNYNSLEECAAFFMKKHTDFLAANPNSKAKWSTDVQANIIEDNDNMLSMRQDFVQNFDGKQIIESILLNFDKKTGNQIKATDVFKDLKGLASRLEIECHQKNRLNFEPNARHENFTYPQGQFPVTDNFCLSRREITFVYNPNTIGGPEIFQTEMTFPLAELTNYLNDAFLPK